MNQIPEEITRLIAEGALFVINHSAGKDSQAMTILLHTLIPADQLLMVHADLGEVEWQGNVEHINANSFGLPLITTCNRRTKFLDMVLNRRMWPSPKYRQCTSDQKRDPINGVIRRYLKANPRFNGKVVSCMGIRAAESSSRAKQVPLRRNERQSLSTRRIQREWWEWLPIFTLSTPQVFALIAAAGQKPHPAYLSGMSRLSCVFCIMANKRDLRIAATLRPALYRTYVKIEKQIGHTLSMEGRPLEEVTGIPALPDEADAPDLPLGIPVEVAA